jgi:hypothetical protein
MAERAAFSDVQRYLQFHCSRNGTVLRIGKLLNEYFGSFTNAIRDLAGLLVNTPATDDGVFGAPIARQTIPKCLPGSPGSQRTGKAFAEKDNHTPAEFFHLKTRLGSIQAAYSLET